MITTTISLADARREAGLTQPQVAEVLGVTVTTISLWENGHHRLPFEKVKELAKIYGVPIERIE